MADSDASRLPARPARPPRLWRVVFGLPVALAGLAAMAAPLLASGAGATFALALLLLGVGIVQATQVLVVQGLRASPWAFATPAASAVAGLLLLASPQLVSAALAALLGLSWVADGVTRVARAFRRTKREGKPLSRASGGPVWSALDGLVSVLLGVAIAVQWPLSGVWAIGILVGLRLLSAGWASAFGADDEGTRDDAADRLDRHPDADLGLPPNAEFARLNERFLAEEDAAQRTDRYWRWTFVVTFFAIHVGRMQADWDLVGLISPAVAVLGDVVIALLLGYLVVGPVQFAWVGLSRPLERRAWRAYLDDVDAKRAASWYELMPRWWVKRRMRNALAARRAQGSPTAAIGWGLHFGLPLTAVLIALNPVWGFSWYFNTENWATAGWERWAEYRVDTWRAHMAGAVRRELAGGADDAAPSDAGTLYQLAPAGLGGAGDFSFLVIGDPGEGDASQLVLRDRYLALGAREDVKFLVVSSDVIYPSGDMRDYEPKFYLPMKGFTKPVYAIPGNHDWYDALEAFAANFLEPRAARAALRARREADHKLTSTTEQRIDELIAHAGWLREQYGVSAAHQRAPFFEVQTDNFALIAVDTGILKTLDDEQLRWLRGALGRARGKFVMALIGHPLYAAGHYQGDATNSFTALHQLLRDHGVAVVMGGDTHMLEHYREPYATADGANGTMSHFVNGGGGAYLSIGTPLDWPDDPAIDAWAFYPRTDAIVAKLDRQTVWWKRPLWLWVKHLNAWPSSPEGMASAFDFNQAPFYQSFVEVRVERSANRVRLIPHGANGQLRWGDLQVGGVVVPGGQDANSQVEFTLPLAVPEN